MKKDHFIESYHTRIPGKSWHDLMVNAIRQKAEGKKLYYIKSNTVTAIISNVHGISELIV